MFARKLKHFTHLLNASRFCGVLWFTFEQASRLVFFFSHSLSLVFVYLDLEFYLVAGTKRINH